MFTCIPYITVITSIIGLILGIISIKNNQGGRGLAIAGIVLSGISLLFGILVAIGCSALLSNESFMQEFYKEFNKEYYLY